MKAIIFVVSFLIGASFGLNQGPNLDKIKECMLGSDAFDCCDFPKPISEDIMKDCFEEMRKSDRRSGRRLPGPPGGMCLFNCFVEKAGYLNGGKLDEATILQKLEAASYGKTNAADWVSVVRAAVPRAYSDYSNMAVTMNLNQTNGGDGNNATACSPSNGYFLARVNAELYTNCPDFNERSPKCVNYRDKVKNCTVFIAKPNRPDRASQIARKFREDAGSDGSSSDASGSDLNSAVGGAVGGAAGAMGGAALANAFQQRNNNRNDNSRDQGIENVPRNGFGQNGDQADEDAAPVNQQKPGNGARNQSTRGPKPTGQGQRNKPGAQTAESKQGAHSQKSKPANGNSGSKSGALEAESKLSGQGSSTKQGSKAEVQGHKSGAQAHEPKSGAQTQELKAGKNNRAKNPEQAAGQQNGKTKSAPGTQSQAGVRNGENDAVQKPRQTKETQNYNLT